MNNIKESLRDLYAVKLFNWQISGEDVESLYKVVDFIENNDDFLAIKIPKNVEMKNWVIGYCKLFKK